MTYRHVPRSRPWCGYNKIFPPSQIMSIFLCNIPTLMFDLLLQSAACHFWLTNIVRHDILHNKSNTLCDNSSLILPLTETATCQLWLSNIFLDGILHYKSNLLMWHFHSYYAFYTICSMPRFPDKRFPTWTSAQQIFHSFVEYFNLYFVFYTICKMPLLTYKQFPTWHSAQQIF